MKLFLSPGWDVAAAGAGGGEGANSRGGGQQQPSPDHQVPRLHDGAYKVPYGGWIRRLFYRAERTLKGLDNEKRCLIFYI
jgi:hypothetical protein